MIIMELAKVVVQDLELLMVIKIFIIDGSSCCANLAWWFIKILLLNYTIFIICLFQNKFIIDDLLNKFVFL